MRQFSLQWEKKNIFYPVLLTHLLHKLWPTHTYQHFCFSYGNHFNLSHTSVSIVVFIFNFLSIYNHCWYNELKEFSFNANFFEWAIWNIILLFKEDEEKKYCSKYQVVCYSRVNNWLLFVLLVNDFEKSVER